MQARITRPYSCAPEGHTTLHFMPGALVTGRTAELAIADGAFGKCQAEMAVYTTPRGKSVAVMNITISSDADKKANIVMFERKNILETAAPLDKRRTPTEDSIMYDLMFKATNKEAWDAFSLSAGLTIQNENFIVNTHNILIDEIGPIIITQAILSEQGNIITPAVIDDSYHVNVRVLQPLTKWIDLDGIEHTQGIDCANLAKGGTNVEWLDPLNVTLPKRIWLGGMNYWLPSN